MNIYLDHAATTSPRPEVLEAMRPLLTERFGNPSSIHRWGREARALLEEARERVAGALGAKRTEIYFTSGGTEADNLAVLGGIRALGTGARVVVSAIEHKAVLGAAAQAAREGHTVVVLAVDQHGVVDLDALDHALAGASHALVSVMWGNNEVGTVQPVNAIAERCRLRAARFHTDAVQAFGREEVRVDRVPCDMLTLSGHKIGAPKGIGALYVREGTSVEALVHGGGQERELRPGTENIAFAVGLGVAAERAAREQPAEAARLRTLRDRLESALVDRVPGITVNGAGAARLPHVLNLSIAGIDQEAMLVSLDLEGIAVSSGSACQSGAVEPSHVLVAMNRARDSEASVRMSLGRSTTPAEIEAVIERMPGVIERVRAYAHAEAR